MNHYIKVRNIFTVGTIALALFACSDSSDKKQSGMSEDAAPAAQQSMQQGATPQGQKALSPAQMAAVNAAKTLPNEGTVLEMMHAAGYTYMRVEAGTDAPMWIAASMMRVKPQQKVKWGDAAVMNNFNSKSLHRTFDQILFVSNAQVIE